MNKKIISFLSFSFVLSASLFGMQHPSRDVTASPPPVDVTVAPVHVAAPAAIPLLPAAVVHGPALSPSTSTPPSTPPRNVVAATPERHVPVMPSPPIKKTPARLGATCLSDSPVVRRRPLFMNPELRNAMETIFRLTQFMCVSGARAENILTLAQKLDDSLAGRIAMVVRESFVESTSFLIFLLDCYRSIMHGAEISSLPVYERRSECAIGLRNVAQQFFQQIQLHINGILAKTPLITTPHDVLFLERFYQSVHKYDALLKIGGVGFPWRLYSGVYFELLFLVKQVKIRLQQLHSPIVAVDVMFDDVVVLLDEHQERVEATDLSRPESFGGGHMERVHSAPVCSRTLSTPMVHDLMVRGRTLCFRDLDCGLKCVRWHVFGGERELIQKMSTLWPRCFTNQLHYFETLWDCVNGRPCPAELLKVGERIDDEHGMVRTVFFRHPHALNMGPAGLTCCGAGEHCPLVRMHLSLATDMLVALAYEQKRLDESGIPSHSITVIRSAYPLIHMLHDQHGAINRFVAYPPRGSTSLPHCSTQLLKDEAHRLWSFSDHCRTTCLRATIHHVACIVRAKIREFEKRSDEEILATQRKIRDFLKQRLQPEERALCDNAFGVTACVNHMHGLPIINADFDVLCDACESLIMQQLHDPHFAKRRQLIEEDIATMSFAVRRNICYREVMHFDCRTAQQVLCGMFLDGLQAMLETAASRIAALRPAPATIPVVSGNCPVIDYLDPHTGRTRRMVMVSLNYENYFPQLDLRHDDVCFRLLDRTIPDRGAFTALSMLFSEEGRLRGTVALLQRCGIFTDRLFIWR